MISRLLPRAPNSVLLLQRRGLHNSCTSYSKSPSHSPQLNRSSENTKYETIDLSTISTREDYQMPKHPIILCHGFSGFDSLIAIPSVSIFDQLMGKNPTKTQVAEQAHTGIELFEYWHGIKKELRSRGCTVLVAKVPPFATIETRSKILNDFIEQKVVRKLDTEASSEPIKVNLVAHSMGGLDCRYLISNLKQKSFQVASLTTISTPHRGSYAADYVLKNFPDSFIDRFFPSIKQLTLASCAEMNKKMPDNELVKYFSYGACYTPHVTSLFYLTWLLVNYKEGPNDGLVSLKSANWGKCLGNLANMDHLDLINWLGTFKRLRNALGHQNFSPVSLYLDLADNLAKEGL